MLLHSVFPLASIPPSVLAIAIAGMVLGGVMGIAGLYFEHQRRRLWHETARVALEKGQPLPPALDAEPQRSPRVRGPAADFRSGLILLGTGVGLYYLVGLGIAAIVGCIGIALLLYALLATIFGRKEASSRDRLPPS